MKKLIVLLLCNLVLSLSIKAETSDKMRAWAGIFGKKSINETFSFWQEFQARYDSEQGQMQQTLFRFGGLKKIHEAHEMGFVMGYIQTGNIREYRPTLQHIYAANFFEKITFSLRSRLEYRNLESEKSDSFRYRLMLNNSWKFSNIISAVIWDEVFVNVTREGWTGDRALERNRFFIGPRFEQTYGRLEVGYLNQYIPRDGFDTEEHILAVNFFY